MLGVRDAVKAKDTIITGMGTIVAKGTRGTVLWVAESGETCKVQFFQADGSVGELIDCQSNDGVLIYDNE